MKKFTFIFAGLALLASAAFTSCEKTPAPSADEGTKSIALSINFGGVGTKTNVDGELEDPYKAELVNPTALQIYFTDNAGIIKYAYSADAESSDDNKIIWDNLTSTTNGVRFIGMEGISKVYVLGNGPEINGLSYDGADANSHNISELNALLTSPEFLDVDTQNKVPYAGATFSLTRTNSVSSSAGEVWVGEESGQDYSAQITLRSAISRLEVNKVSVKSEGDVFFKVDNGNLVKTTEADATYKVHYSNFKPSLVGLYMSNFYKSAPLFSDNTTSLSSDWTNALFSTPAFNATEAPIVEGLWRSGLLDDDTNNYASYTTWNGTGYDNLVSAASVAEGNNVVLFNGNGTKVLPYNFFVPYKIDEQASTANAISGAIFPALHFQFKEQDSSDPIEAKVYYREQTSEPWPSNEVTEDNLNVAATVEWPHSVEGEDGIAFANVVTFYKEAGSDEAELLPGRIYKVAEVNVDPTNINLSTKATDAQNVYVVVTVAPFTTENVVPGFDK